MTNLLTPKQAAKIATVSRGTIINHISVGALKAHKVGRQWRIYQSDLEKWIQGDDLAANEHEKGGAI